MGTPHVQRIDVHRHYIPSFLIEEARRHSAIDGLRVDGDVVKHRQGYHYPLEPEFHDIEALIASLDAGGVHHAVMSVTPTLFFYNCSSRDAAEFCQRTNTWISDVATGTGNRLSGMGNLPMQDPEAASAELRRCVEDLGIRCAQIGTDIEGVPLDDPRYAAFFETAEELNAVLLLHPYFVGARAGFEDYYMTNLVGLPLSTTVAASRLLFSGFFSRHRVRFILVHGGGYLPYKIGRLDRGYRVRPESSAATDRPPSEWLSYIYYDTLTHSPDALRFLVEFAGADHVLFGTDLPFDMTDPSQDWAIDGLPEDVSRRVWGENARDLLGLPARSLA